MMMIVIVVMIAMMTSPSTRPPPTAADADADVSAEAEAEGGDLPTEFVDGHCRVGSDGCWRPTRGAGWKCVLDCVGGGEGEGRPDRRIVRDHKNSTNTKKQKK
jgi:hypothetical protein